MKHDLAVAITIGPTPRKGRFFFGLGESAIFEFPGQLKWDQNFRQDPSLTRRVTTKYIVADITVYVGAWRNQRCKKIPHEVLLFCPCCGQIEMIFRGVMYRLRCGF